MNEGEETAIPKKVRVRRDGLDKRLILIVSGILLIVCSLLITFDFLQWNKYHQAIGDAIHQSPPDHAAAICYARALDEAIIKTSALMLAFIIVFLGMLYVLRTATAAYELGLSGDGYSGSLKTSSPGLVMMTLGLAIVAVAILSKQDIDYTTPPLPAVNVVAPVVPPPTPASPGLGFEKDPGK